MALLQRLMISHCKTKRKTVSIWLSCCGICVTQIRRIPFLSKLVSWANLLFLLLKQPGRFIPEFTAVLHPGNFIKTFGATPNYLAWISQEDNQALTCLFWMYLFICLVFFSSLLENGIAKRHKRIVLWRTWLWSYSSSEGLHLSPIKLVIGSQATGNVVYRHE